MKELKISASFVIFDNFNELLENDKALFLEAKKACDNAYAPYSKFHVGAALLLENGKVVLGSNQENAAYPSGMCAERVAIWKASSQYPNIKIKKLFITAKSNNKIVKDPVAPCGACRQTIAEYEVNQDDNIEVFFGGEEGNIIKSNSLSDLLPLGFDKSML